MWHGDKEKTGRLENVMTEVERVASTCSASYIKHVSLQAAPAVSLDIQ